MIVAINKADKLARDLPVVVGENKVDEQSLLQHGSITDTLPSVRVSALTGEGIEDLLICISENLVLQFVQLAVLIPYDRGELVARFHHFGTIEEESYEAGGTRIRGHMPENQAGALLPFRRSQTGSLQVHS